MRQIEGNLWDYKGPGFALCITTNGTVKKNGDAVMGRGCASEAKTRIPQLPRILGRKLQQGNVVQDLLSHDAAGLTAALISFPVKHNWWEAADLKLIRASAIALKSFAEQDPERVFVLPRPGCGNGRLKWEEVAPLLVDLPDNVWVISKPQFSPFSKPKGSSCPAS